MASYVQEALEPLPSREPRSSSRVASSPMADSSVARPATSMSHRSAVCVAAGLTMYRQHFGLTSQPLGKDTRELWDDGQNPPAGRAQKTSLPNTGKARFG